MAELTAAIPKSPMGVFSGESHVAEEDSRNQPPSSSRQMIVPKNMSFRRTAILMFGVARLKSRGRTRCTDQGDDLPGEADALEPLEEEAGVAVLADVDGRVLVLVVVLEVGAVVGHRVVGVADLVVERALDLVKDAVVFGWVFSRSILLWVDRNRRELLTFRSGLTIKSIVRSLLRASVRKWDSTFCRRSALRKVGSSCFWSWMIDFMIRQTSMFFLVDPEARCFSRT